MAVKTHTDLSPSNASRWMNCPGSIALCKTVPKPPQSEYASEGGTAHALLEKCLKNPSINPFDLVGDKLEGNEVVEEMAEAVSYALDVIRADLQNGGELLIEQKLDIVPGIIGGTLDVAVIREFNDITVYDFKYGKGVIVSAVDNQQLLLYLLPLVKKHDVVKMKLTIIQPRTEGQLSTWECSAEYLEGFAAEVERKIKLTQEENALVCAGSWCKFCWAKVVCPALRKDLGQALAPIKNNELIFPDVKSLTLDVVKKVLDNRDRIEDWMAAVAAYAQEAIESGSVIPGYELGKRRSIRKWVSEIEALKEFADLGDKAYSVKILSPAQMEKVAGKDRVSKLTEVPDNGMTLKKLKEN